MNRTIRSSLVAYSSVILLPTICTAASWEGVRILPKSSRTPIVAAPGSQASVGLYQMEWPAAVRKTDGQWLQISDTGGYSAPPAEGWVRKDDIVRLDEAQAYSTRKIQECEARRASPREAAEFYWLRGLYWEFAGETESAIADYDRAAAAGDARAANVYLGLGRALARRSNHLALPAETRAALSSRADQSFGRAKATFERSLGGRCPPQLYATWGHALYERYRANGRIQDGQAALEKFRLAEQLRPAWFVAAHGQGRVLFALAGANNPDPQTLLAAIQCFTRSISANPNFAEAYRERADALVALAMTHAPYVADPRGGREVREAAFTTTTQADAASALRNQRLALLNEALDSVERAYLLGNNREPGSLETKARVEAAIARVVYADDPPLRNKPVPADLKRPIDQARSLYRRASTNASIAANYSQTLDEVDRRMNLAVDCHNRARQYAGYLANRAATPVATTSSIREASAKLASAAEQAGQIEQNLALQAADLHAAPVAAAIAQHSASMAKVKKEASDVQNQLKEAVAKAPSERLQDLETLRSRVSDTSEAIKREHAVLSERLTAEPDVQKRKGLQAALEKNQELSKTLEQAADDLSQAAPEPSVAPTVDDLGPIYTPLFLSR